MAREYCAGKRARFVPPVRAYLFTSAVFFLVFFAVSEPDDVVRSNVNDPVTVDKRIREAKLLRNALPFRKSDSAMLQRHIIFLEDTTKRITNQQLDSLEIIEDGDTAVQTIASYRESQKSLPSGKQDSWIKRRFKERTILFREKYKGNQEEGFKQFGKVFLHTLPYLLFLSLPFFGGILRLLYARHRQWFYSDHMVFTLHHYIFAFIVLLLIFLLNWSEEQTGWNVFSYIVALLSLTLPLYLYKAMRNFYKQRRAKTVGKFLLLNFIGFIVITLLLLVFMIFSFFQI